MTTRAIAARHRAEVTTTNSLAVIAKALGDNAGGMGRQAAVIAAASGLVLTSGIAANAADTNVQRESASASNLEVEVSAPAIISAASTIAISYEKPAVTTEAAPVVEAPKPVVKVQEAAPVEEAAAPVEAAPAVQTASVKTAVTTEAAPAKPAASSGMGAGRLPRPVTLNPGDADAPTDLEIDGYITKPIDFDRLLETVAELTAGPANGAGPGT